MWKNSYWSPCIHIHGWPGRDAKHKVCKVDWYQLCFCEFHLVGLLDMLIQIRMRNTKVMCVNAEHGETQTEWDIKELPVLFHRKVATVHNRPAACESPGTWWDVTSRMNRCSFSPWFWNFHHFRMGLWVSHTVAVTAWSGEIFLN